MTQVVGRPSPGDGIPEQIADAIRERTLLEPVAGVVLGSGLSEAVDEVRSVATDEGVELSYAELPGFPPPTVAGHAGRLWLGEVRGRGLAVFQGRVHFYEGHGMPMASLTSRVSAELGARTMVLTAATGALDPAIEAGSLVILRDHLNLIGTNPLLGWRMPDGSPPFVDVSAVYDRELAEAALASARSDLGELGGSHVREGVYAALSGPSYETPAETRMLSDQGATVVGMSTVPEAVVARALGMRVLGIAFATNAAGVEVTHDEVLAASKAAAGTIGRVVVDLIERL
ncbi:MAG TPA: purine-nucleoside phosphorylase [Actinomycetota bacterium]|jgi:purine-nucleoside phosphorylase|nr:purine-nucleoside phosphorylase [Actinomycetota bacterium]